MQNLNQANLQEELLKQWAEQVRRSPVPVFLSMALVAYMASEYVSAWFWGGWLLLVLATQVVRWSVFRQLPLKTHIPVEKRIRVADLINLGGTILHSVSFIWFPLFSPYQAAVQCMLILGMGVGSVMMSAGYPPWARAHVFFGLVPMFSFWAWSGVAGPGGNTAMFLALIGIGYCTTVLRIADHIFSLYKASFKTREQLEIALERAEAAGRAKTRFLASASHDLRQPIHALALLSAALAMKKLDESTRQLVDNINASVEALTYELDGLLDISKLDAGIVNVNRTNVGLTPLLQRLHEGLASLAERRGTKLLLDCPPNLFVWTDRVLLERILVNIINNAIHHNADCIVTVRVRLVGSGVQLVVSDTGRGIDPSEHENVFEEFYQLENLERDRGKGLGLGLSIVRRLDDLLGLKMVFESAPGWGTRFTFSLPAADPNQVGTPQGGPSLHSLESLVVLVVDDEQAVRDGMRAILEERGCEVVLVDGTEAAVAAASSNKPDIALVDLRLRNRDDGLITIDRLQALYPELPVVIISGDTAPDRLLAVSKRNIPVLTKPVLIGPLEEAIIRHCFPKL